MSAATLTSPVPAVWPTYHPVVPRPRNANANSPAAYGNPQLSGGDAGAATEPNSELAMFIALMMDMIMEPAMSKLTSVGGDDDEGGDDVPVPMSATGILMPLFIQAAMANAQAGGTGGTGDANVGPISGSNPAGIAESVRGQSAAQLMSSQRLPMHQGVPTDVCCANFVSACLQKAGLLSSSEHTDSAPQLKSTLQGKGWRTVSRSQAKPGDVCFVLDSSGTPEHVELVAKNNNGSITLIGSNNTQGGSGPQVVSNDTYTGNRGNVVFLSPP
jgi:hypothetical protein